MFYAIVMFEPLRSLHPAPKNSPMYGQGGKWSKKVRFLVPVEYWSTSPTKTMLESPKTPALALDSFYNVKSLVSSSGWEVDLLLGENTTGSTKKASKSTRAGNKSGYISKSNYVLSKTPVSLTGVGVEVYLVLTLLLELSDQPEISYSSVSGRTRSSINPHTETACGKELAERRNTVCHNMKTLEQVWGMIHLRYEYVFDPSSEIAVVRTDVNDSNTEYDLEKLTSTTGVAVTAMATTAPAADTTETNENVVSVLNLDSNPDEGIYRDMAQAPPEFPNLPIPLLEANPSSCISPGAAVIRKDFIPFGADTVPTRHRRTLTIRTNAFFSQVMPYLPVVCELTHTHVTYKRAAAVNGLSMSILAFTDNSTIANAGSSRDGGQDLPLGVDKAVALVLKLMGSPMSPSSSITNSTT